MCLAPQQCRARQQGDGELQQTGDQRLAMADAVDRGDADAKGDCAEGCALPVEGVVGEPRMRQITPAEHQRHDADRRVHREQKWPGGHGQDACGDRRADGGGNRHHHGIDADATAELRVRIGVAHQRGIHAHDAGSAKPCRMRETVSHASECDSAQSTEASVNSSSPAR